MGIINALIFIQFLLFSRFLNPIGNKNGDKIENSGPIKP